MTFTAASASPCDSDSAPPSRNLPAREETGDSQDASIIQADKSSQEDGIAQALIPNPNTSEPANATDVPMTLGSVVELELDLICATSASEVELREFANSGNEGNHSVIVRGRLLLSGGVSQRSVANANICLETNHCENQTCLRLGADNGDPVTLRFKLSPDVATAPLPRLFLEIRSRRSQKLKMSLWITVGYLLKKLSLGVKYQSSLPLLDEQDHCCGRLMATFRGGLLTDLENSDQTWTTVIHQAEACTLTVKVSNLQATGNERKDCQCLTRIWTSATGKTHSQTISPLKWQTGEAATKEANAVLLQVTDAATEMIFVAIHRYSTHERNEMIGLGSFSIYSLRLPTEDINSLIQPVDQIVTFYSEFSKIECGSMLFSLQISHVLREKHENKKVSLAATALGTIAYPLSSGERKCRFDIDILEVKGIPLNILQDDSISILFRIAQNNWKTHLAPVKVARSGNGDEMQAHVGESVHTVICWAAKDRSFPVLEISVYVHRKRQPKRKSLASRTSLAATSQAKRRQIPQEMNETVASVLMATGSFNLSSFFSHQNVSVLADSQLHVVKPFMEKKLSGEKIMEKVSLLLRLRASPSPENGSQLLPSDRVPNDNLLSVKGDVCIHLLEASGSVFKRATSLSSYYVSISIGSEEILSSCCLVDDANTITWNQHLILPIESAKPPVIDLTLYQRTIDAVSSAQHDNASTRHTCDQLVGYLTLPMFPSVHEKGHLLQLELPFGMPLSNDAEKQGDDAHYYKRGTLTLEIQFLSSGAPKTDPILPSDSYELVIHQVRGDLQDTSASRGPSGLTKHIFIDISIMVDRGGTTEELAVGPTKVFSLSTSGLTDVAVAVDLSNPIIATTLSNAASNVLVGRIRDVIGNNYGRVHFPLRNDWKERLVKQKKQSWYPICIESPTADGIATKNAVLMSLRVRPQSDEIPRYNVSGQFHVNVCEVILTSSLESSNLIKLRKYGGANVQLVYISTNGSTEIARSRTRQSTEQNSSQHWRWENEWFVFPHSDKFNSSHELEVSLHIGVESTHPRLDDRLNLASIIEDTTLRRRDYWIPLSDRAGHDETVCGHLHMVVVYIPTIVGTLSMDFSESYTFSESERMLHVEKLFYKCTIHETSCCTEIVAENGPENHPTDATNGSSYEHLRLPLDTRLSTTTKMPELLIQQMGVTKILGEFCLGVLCLDFLAISELCCLTSSPGVAPERSTWCKFSDKSDRTKTTGVAKLRIGFESNRDLVDKQKNGTLKNFEERVTAAELCTIWKKLFYLLDQNGNGYIERNEFTNVFMNHLEDMVETSDGQKLLQLLFGVDGSQDSNVVPTQHQITTLFSKMDTNRDHEIEWSEYLRFLQQQQQMCTIPDINDENPATAVQSAQVKQNCELRKKNRQDRRPAPSSSADQSVVESNQDEIPPEQTRNARSGAGLLQQEPAAPKRPMKVSSSEEKRLKIQYSSQEQTRLQQQLTSLETILALERRRYAELAADRQALMRSYQQLHLKHQNAKIQEKTKIKWMKQTIARQQQQLEERETLRQNQNQASIVLQSTVRARLEQKRYQGLKLQRINAAIAVQCLVRRVKAKKELRGLLELERVTTQRVRAVLKIQRFVRFHLHRKERSLLGEARTLSATILQKNTRRMIAYHVWQRQKFAVLKLQRWVRQHLALAHSTELQSATFVVQTAVLGWFTRGQYTKVKASSNKLQKWWRRVRQARSAYMELLDAVLCIQSAWKRTRMRKWDEREWQRQEKDLSELEAAICIQEAWRGRIRSSPRFEDASEIEARLYDMVAIVEAHAAWSDDNVIVSSTLIICDGMEDRSNISESLTAFIHEKTDGVDENADFSRENPSYHEAAGVAGEILVVEHQAYEATSANSAPNDLQQDEILENPDGSDLFIIQNLLQELKDWLETCAVGQDSIGMVSPLDVLAGDTLRIDSEEDEEEQGGSSIDSSDLMIEADAMASLQEP